MSKVIFLDLDGTLTDAGPGIKNCFNYALDKMGLPEITANNDWIVGPPLWDSFAKVGVVQEQLDHAVDLYRERYRDVGCLENALYAGVLEQLSNLKDHNFTLCLATSNRLNMPLRSQRILVLIFIWTINLDLNLTEPDLPRRNC